MVKAGKVDLALGPKFVDEHLVGDPRSRITTIRIYRMSFPLVAKLNQHLAILVVI